MTKAKKADYIQRIYDKMLRLPNTWLANRPDAERIFKVSMAFHSKLVAGNQSKKPSRKVMDEAYDEAFSSIIRALK